MTQRLYKFNYIGEIVTRYDSHMIHEIGLCILNFSNDIPLDDIDNILAQISEKIRTRIKEELSMLKYGRTQSTPKKWYQSRIPKGALSLFSFEKVEKKTQFSEDLYASCYNFVCTIKIDKDFIDDN